MVELAILLPVMVFGARLLPLTVLATNTLPATTCPTALNQLLPLYS